MFLLAGETDIFVDFLVGDFVEEFAFSLDLDSSSRRLSPSSNKSRSNHFISKSTNSSLSSWKEGERETTKRKKGNISAKSSIVIFYFCYLSISIGITFLHHFLPDCFIYWCTTHELLEFFLCDISISILTKNNIKTIRENSLHFLCSFPIYFLLPHQWVQMLYWDSPLKTSFPCWQLQLRILKNSLILIHRNLNQEIQPQLFFQLVLCLQWSSHTLFFKIKANASAEILNFFNNKNKISL